MKAKEKPQIEKDKEKYTKDKPQWPRCDRVSIMSDAEYAGERIPFYNTFKKEGENVDKDKLFFPSKEFGMKKKIEVMEISAKERIKIDDAFKKIIDLILSNKTDKEIIDEFGIKNNNNDINLDKSKTKKKKQRCCGK